MTWDNFENNRSSLYRDLKKLNEVIVFMVDLGYTRDEIKDRVKTIKKYISHTHKVNLMLEDENESKDSKN